MLSDRGGLHISISHLTPTSRRPHEEPFRSEFVSNQAGLTLFGVAFSCGIAVDMSGAPARTLEELWRSAPKGRLSSLEQLKAVAYRDVLQEAGAKKHGLHKKIAEKLTLSGGGHPQRNAVRKLLAKVDADDGWYPGKSYQESFGPAPVLSGPNRQAIAKSAMNLKKNGSEPTFRLVVARCPRASINPNTSKTVDKKRIYDVMREKCYDDGADLPWKHRPRLQKSALPKELQEKRWAWAKELKRTTAYTSGWCYMWVVWTDLCNDILPRSQAKATEQALARKGKSGWCSDGSQGYSANLRGKDTALKQNSWDTERVWWAPFLARGKLHVEVFPSSFAGEAPDGAAALADLIPRVLAARFPNAAKPRVVMTDRGRGFFWPASGRITPQYQAALHRNGLRAFAGENAASQPANAGDMMLHETAVAWLRHLMKISLPARPWAESREAFTTRLRQAAQKINAEYDVASLCREFPERLDDLDRKQGDKLRK